MGTSVKAEPFSIVFTTSGISFCLNVICTVFTTLELLDELLEEELLELEPLLALDKLDELFDELLDELLELETLLALDELAELPTEEEFFKLLVEDCCVEALFNPGICDKISAQDTGFDLGHREFFGHCFDGLSATMKQS